MIALDCTRTATASFMLLMLFVLNAYYAQGSSAPLLKSVTSLQNVRRRVFDERSKQ